MIKKNLEFPLVYNKIKRINEFSFIFITIWGLHVSEIYLFIILDLPQD